MAENKDKCALQFLGKNCICGTSRAYFRTFVIQLFLCDLFFIMKETDFSSYADHNTSYRTADTNEEVIKLLESDSAMLFKWFSDNQLKASISKYHLLVNKKDEVVINLEETEIDNSDYEKLSKLIQN